ncbi:hypothetical protein P5673_032391, partial [Acropora cervicornis]
MGHHQKHNRQTCPTKDARCHNCSKQGHFAKCCRAKSRVNMVSEVELAETSSSDSKVFLGEVSANKHKAYDLRCRGEFQATLKYGPKTWKLTIYALDDLNGPLLERIACQKLRVVANADEIASPERTPGHMERTHPKVFTGLGCMPGEYEIKLREGANQQTVSPFLCKKEEEGILFDLNDMRTELVLEILLLEIWTRPKFLRSSLILSSGGWSPGAVAVHAYCSKGISKRTSMSFSLVGVRRRVLNGISGKM